MALDRTSQDSGDGRAAVARNALEALGPLFRYPVFGESGAEFSDLLSACRRAFAEAPPEPRAAIERFAASASALSAPELQELYTHTFDLSPICALEIGWHLHGESYDRGRLLVRMRQLLEQMAIDEAGELPDHLSSMLLALARLDPATRAELGHRWLIPAVARMLAAFDGKNNPYADALRAADGAIRLLVGEPDEEPSTPSRTAPHHRRRSP